MQYNIYKQIKRYRYVKPEKVEHNCIQMAERAGRKK